METTLAKRFDLRSVRNAKCHGKFSGPESADGYGDVPKRTDGLSDGYADKRSGHTYSHKPACGDTLDYSNLQWRCVLSHQYISTAKPNRESGHDDHDGSLFPQSIDVWAIC